MKIEVFKNLCYYDSRNPEFICKECFSSECYRIEKGEKTIEQQGECSCDNCFYGRSELANIILELKDDYDELLTDYKELSEYSD